MTTDNKADNTIDNFINEEIDKILRLRYISVILPLVLAMLLKLYSETRWYETKPLSVTVAEYGSPAFIGISFCFVLFWYLQTGFKDRQIFMREINSSRKIRPSASPSFESSEIIKQLKVDVEELKRNSSLARHPISQDVLEKIAADTKSTLLLQLQEKAEDSVKKSIINEEVAESRALAIRRLEDELKRLIRSSSVNLTFGVFIAILGILALGIFVFPNIISSYTAPTPLTLDDATPSSIALHYGPRFSLVVSIEILAYFFLRLHKSNLNEIKYYQNELTNLELKYISLSTAIQLGRNETSHKVISALSETERNHLLEKGQSTTELKKIELERNQFIEVTKSLASIVPKPK